MRGFSLVEILVSLVIVSILIFALFSVMEVGRNSWFNADTSVQLRQEIIRAFMTMERELKETRPAQISLTSGSSSSLLTFKIPQDNNGDATILDASGNVEWSGNIVYALNGSGQITRTASGVTSILAQNVTGLLFTRPSSALDILQIDITAQKNSDQGRMMQDAGQIIVKMRN